MKSKVLITGASSYLGAGIFYYLKDKVETVGTYHNTPLSKSFLQLDATDFIAVKKLIQKVKPSIVIHAAANANARWCDAHPKEAINLNQKATEIVTQAADEIGAKIILISSYSAKKPVNVYGKTKAESESIVKKARNGYVILEPSLVIGLSPNTENDRPFNRLLKNIEGKPAEYDTSWKFQPTYLKHISDVILATIEKQITDEIIPIAVPEVKTRFDVARDILSPFGIVVKAIDAKDQTPLIVDDLTALRRLNLPIYTYEEVIQNCIREIKERKKFIL